MLDFLNKNSLNINCDIACMTRDTENTLERYDAVNINCGVCIVSSEVYSKLLGKGANINSDQTIVTDYQGEFLLNHTDCALTHPYISIWSSFRTVHSQFSSVYSPK